jgi:hypothetical protein
MTGRSLGTVMLAGTLMLGGCSTREADNQTAAAPAPTVAADAGVTRDVVAAPTPSPTPTPAAALQTQTGPQGTSVALNSVRVTGDIMTVSLTFSGGTCCVQIPLNEVSAIDDATAQRIGVLKDNAGQWMAAPLGYIKTTLSVDSQRNPLPVWFKFPAPPATSKTVSLALPGVAPFEPVPVAR